MFRLPMFDGWAFPVHVTAVQMSDRCDCRFFDYIFNEKCTEFHSVLMHDLIVLSQASRYPALTAEFDASFCWRRQGNTGRHDLSVPPPCRHARGNVPVKCIMYFRFLYFRSRACTWSTSLAEPFVNKDTACKHLWQNCGNKGKYNTAVKFHTQVKMFHFNYLNFKSENQIWTLNKIKSI